MPANPQMGPGVMGGKLEGPGLANAQALPGLPKVSGALLSNPVIEQAALNNVKK